MGEETFDKYSWSHLCFGSISRYLGFSFTTALLFHITFEVAENTETGMNFITNYFPFWIGGKTKADTFRNSIIGDNVSFAVGYIIASVFLA
jgi:hypothetical protein